MKLDRKTIADQLAAKTAPNFADPEVRKSIIVSRETLKRDFLGREYPHLIAGRHLLAGPDVGTYTSVNPNDTRMSIGRFQHFDPVHMPLDDLLPKMRLEMRRRYQHTTVEEVIDGFVSIHELARERFWLLVAAKQYETGQSLAEAYWETDEEVDFPLAHALYLQECWKAARIMPTADICGEFNGMRLVPHGIFATISPFNFPGAIGMRMNTLALAGMNPVIEKSSDKSSLCGFLMMSIIAEGLERAGIDPALLVGFAPGPGGTMADALLSSPDVAGFSFTGSSDVYETIHEKHWKMRRHGWGGKMRLAEGAVETSGVNVFVVWEDADPIAAARAYVMSFVGRSGQKCSSARIAMVHDRIADAFNDEARRFLSNEIVYGDILDLERPAHLGAVISGAAVQKLHDQIAALRSECIVSEFEKPIPMRPHAYDFAPRMLFAQPYAVEARTIGANRKAHTLMNTELFGPVSTVVRVRSLDDVDRLVECSEFALTGAFFTGIPDVAEHLIGIMPCGNLYVNRKCTGAFVETEDFGGLRSRSGAGIKGMFALANFVSKQIVSGVYPHSAHPDAAARELNYLLTRSNFVLSKRRS